MTRFIVFLRAVNVGGTGRLPMDDLRRLCTECGCSNVRTYIASGNVVLDSTLKAAELTRQLEAKLHDYAGKPVGVIVLTVDELVRISEANPFADKPGNKATVVFLAEPAPSDAAQTISGVKTEQVAVGKRELFVFYPDGMAKSKLKLPAAASGTARNLNTVAKMLTLAQ